MTTAYAKLHSINEITVYKKELLSKFFNFANAKVQLSDYRHWVKSV